ncbi:hypothetical protein AJ79_07503 [Helicocarpus griseus UAMH5409]|uniref:ATP synthase subunit f, mitochondrial n=1 Tax=Helicocarpus griseus UAMH5409 TaxID=1447875 RepID=A0A2B7X1N4_9EURO|nr:hypothetical protein AJ79_07503 [Helicocarpus griseus UAMH5409]
MSFITRRGLSTLIPPKVASPTGIGAAQDAARMERIVGFYEKLPRGAAPEVKPTGLIGRYQARYFGKNPSAMPILHVIGGIMLLGYSMEYYFHLRECPTVVHLLPLIRPAFPACISPSLIIKRGCPPPLAQLLSGKEAEHHPKPPSPTTTSVISALTKHHSSIVMAEHSSHDVVNQTRSGGEISPSDVPANTPDNFAARGDAGGVQQHHQFSTNDKVKQRLDTTSQERKQDTSGMTPTTIVDGSISSGHEADNFCDRNLGNGTKGKSNINGLGESSHTGDDRVSPLQLGDASGGSDTDTSRTDIRSSADGSQHARTSSVKRSVFKPVSYAKFSVTKSPGPLQASRASTDNKTPFSSASSTPSISQPAKPRLVAKTTGGLRDSGTKSSAIGSKIGGSGPDPNQVWNKNRPVQPTPAKHLTDEELKQQYGIHMTSRIQEDGNGKEAKWADIDDDEDDWAPETIEWNDGTKITLTHTENVPLSNEKDKDPTKDTKPSPPPADDKPRESSKLLLSKPSSIGPNATVLKLGANAEKQSKPGESKGHNEKPILTSKAQSAAHKSPWAPLPPIDKVPPVTINPSLPGPPSRFPQRDQHAPGHVPRSTSPAKEIAADDFNRSWRDTQSNAPRELYNSQSGRYEPVLDTRRGPVRNEPNFRPPSLLQRPHGEQPGAGEPSPTFQSHRSVADNSSWGRRRASSNVSGGSGGFARRMSFGKPPVNGLNDRSTSPLPHHKGPYPPRGISPSQYSMRQNRAGPNTHYAPPGFHSGAPQQAAPLPAEESVQAQPPFEDPIAMQQRIMREKRDRARQRRKEEEEREEAAKQERIRLKLQAMGLSTEKPSEQTPEKQPDRTPEKPTAQEPSAPSEPSKPAMGSPVRSPPKPPVPEPSGEPKQYGMMKVHHPESAKKLVAASERGPEKPFPNNNQTRQPPSPTRESKVDSVKPLSTNINGVRPSAEPSPIESRHEPVMDDKPPQWKGPLAGPPSYTTWSGPTLSTHPAPTASLWGPPSNDKALGNGTFDRNLTGFPRDLPLPIGPPSANDRLGSAERSRSMADNGLPSSPLSSPEERPSRLVNSEPLKPIARPTPIGPPISHTQRWQHGIPRQTQETTAWNDFHAVAAKTEAEENEKFHRELAALREEEARTGVQPASLQVSFNETWKQVESDQAGQRQVVGVTRTERGAPLPPLHGFGPAVAGLPFSEVSTKPLTNTTGRESRFFPPSSEQVKRTTIPIAYPRSPSPPPPDDISSHPVFTGDSQRPLVHLPTPKPRVKLPPRQASPPPPPATFASMVAAPARPTAQSVTNTTSWQDRFNGLFGKKPSPGKTHVLAVTSATKEPLEVQPSTSPASVSFPQYDEIELLRDAGKVTSRDVEDEEAIFEDREAGSTPVVKMPIMAPKAAWQPALPPSHSRLRPKYQKPVQSSTIEPYISAFFDDDNSAIVIHLPGRDVAKTISLPKKGGNTSSRQRGPSTFKRKNVKPRDGTGNYGHSQASRKHPQSTSSMPRPHSGNNSWANRSSGTAH